jgi:hypothetical protein
MSCWIAGFGSESDTVPFRTLSAWADGQTTGASLVEAQQRLRKMVLDTLPTPPQLRESPRRPLRLLG